MPIHDLNTWQDILLGDRRGRVWWYNLQFDVAHNNIPADVAERFMDALKGAIEALTDDRSPFDVLLSTAGSFSQKGNRSPVVEPFSRVVDAHSFAHFNVDWEQIGLAAENLKDQVWNRFRRGKIVPERHFANYLKTGRDFFWGTPTRRLEEVYQRHGIQSPTLFVDPPEKGDQVATEIRNLLGLSYMNGGVGLYRIDIPETHLEGITVCAPTTLDSSPLCVFLPPDEKTPFGCTLHLDRLEPGAEEVLIGALEFTWECKVTQLGFIRDPLPDESAVWAALETMVEKRLASRAIGDPIDGRSDPST